MVRIAAAHAQVKKMALLGDDCMGKADG